MSQYGESSGDWTASLRGGVASLCLLTLSVALGTGELLPASADEASYRRALKRYKERMRDSALSSRNSGRVDLAASKDLRAFRILRRDYAKPERPKEPVQYLIAEGASIYFDAGFAEVWRAWMQDRKKARDAWLWFYGSAACLRADAAEIGRPISSEQNVFLRAASLEALATHISSKKVQVSDVAKRILLELQSLPQGRERGVLVGSLAAVALALKPHLKEASVRHAIAQVIKQNEHDQMPAWAKLAVARHMAQLTGMPFVTTRTDMMLDALQGSARPPSPEDERYAPPTFMGVKATGTRICYVIDCSDSMLKPLTPMEKDALRGPTLAGPPADAKDAKKASIEDELDWEKIRNRFDAAREFLKLSLARLTKDQSFAIVCFGTKANVLKGVPGMRRATKARIRKAIARLNSMKAGSPTEHRVDGQLLGDTNLHAALRLAFRVIQKGQIEGREHVDPRGFTEGCDTMFLLSDGAPTVDDYPGTAEGYRFVGGRTYDRETGTSRGSGRSRLRQGTMKVEGPYSGSGSRWLKGDVQRMNMFRKVEIHCIGLGDADEWYLESLAQLGLGTVLMI